MIKLSKSAEKPFEFQRGTSIRLPLIVKYNNDKPLDLTDYSIYFTLKPSDNQYSLGGDSDYQDERAYITKDIIPEAPETGRANIDLTPKDTWIPEGFYYFDIQLNHIDKGAVTRLCTLGANIVPGPTNRTVWDSGDEPDLIEDSIVVTLDEGTSIVAIVPLMVDPPESLVESITPKPNYLITYDENDEDRAHPILQLFTCREEYAFELDYHTDHAAYKVYWERNTHRPKEPAVKGIRIIDDRMFIDLKDSYTDVYVNKQGEFYDKVTMNGVNPVGKQPQVYSMPNFFQEAYRISEPISGEYMLQLLDEVKGGTVKLQFTNGNFSTRKLLIEFSYHWPRPNVITPDTGFLFGTVKYYDVEGELDG